MEGTPRCAPPASVEGTPRDAAGGTPLAPAAEEALPCAGNALCILCLAFRGRPGSSAIAISPDTKGIDPDKALWEEMQQRDKDGTHKLVGKVGLLWGFAGVSGGSVTKIAY